MKRIYTAAHLPDAQLLVHTLECHGVRARVFNENLQGGVGDLPHVYPEVWIENERDWEQARSLAASFDRGVTQDKGVIRCPHCHEDNPSTFEICWQCGTAVSPLNESHGGQEEEAKDD